MKVIPLLLNHAMPIGTAVLANGDFPQKSAVLKALLSAKEIICCDGAAQALIDCGRIPDAIVGDCDSLSDELKARYADRVVQIPEQETNDLSKCMRFIKERGARDAVLFGITGKREDHTLANLSLLNGYRKQFESIAAISDYGEFTPIFETTAFESERGQQVSIFAFPPVARLSFSGLMYPMECARPEGLWAATLNQAEDDRFTIQLWDEGPVLVERVFERKG